MTLPRRQTKRVLVVEDHRLLCKVLDSSRTSRWWASLTPSVSASHAFLSEGQGFDVAVVDLSLPDSDEAELIEELPSVIDETERLARTEGT